MRRRAIIIELTSLLDVILIMMFMLITNARGQVDIANERTLETERAVASLTDTLNVTSQQLDTARAEVNDLTDENNVLKAGLLSIDIVKENCAVITITVDVKRVVRIQYADVVKTVELSWDDENYAKNALRTALANAIEYDEHAQAAFIIFQYDRNTVYQSDFLLIDSAIQVHKNSPDVYTATYDVKGE